MKASICPRYGLPSELQLVDLPMPVPTEDDIVVKVNASTVNRTDCAILSATPIIMRLFTGILRPKNLVPGTEFSGVVVEAGAAVTKYKAGDRVFGFNDLGLSAHAEYLAINTGAAIAQIPENLTYTQAAASIEGAHYAFNYINKVNVEQGSRVLINGASGAIGSALLQFCVALGAEVIAVSESKHRELLLTLGASSVIDYTETDFTKDAGQYDFVFDVVGSSSYFECRSLLANNGIYISSELGRFCQNLYLPLLTKFWSRKKVIFPIPAAIQESLHYIQQQIEEEKYIPVLDTIYSLDQVAEAYAYVMQGKKRGNVVVQIGEQ